MVVTYFNYLPHFISVFTVVIIFLNQNSNVQALSLDRRTCLEYFSSLAISSSTLNDELSPIDTSNSSSSSSTSFGVLPSMPENVEITNKVFMDVRISRSDGSTYIRDDLPDTFENRVLFQRITIGLYGKLVPNHVEKFLSYIEQPTTTTDFNNIDIDNPYPSYGRSNFPALDQETGLLMAGSISSLRAKDVAGSTALTYGSRVLPANLWIENSSTTTATTPKLSHSTKGLLTHRNLNVLPNFGITTRSTPTLDVTNTVFGQVMWDDDTLKFFRELEDIPTYSVGRPADYDNYNDNDFNAGAVAAKTVFNAQREFFRGAAKSMGDDRVGKLYDGKLLRRFEVLQVGRV
jgi:cyclophilin family peptidyl-prolyl cis-trans isomerase